MHWLNYHHLLYFWTAVREGSITRACRVLHLTQPTVSGQIRQLERSLKTKLFERSKEKGDAAHFPSSFPGRRRRHGPAHWPGS